MAKNSLFDQLKNVGIAKGDVMSTSKLLETDPTTTSMPILNIAWSGRVDGGIPAGITVFAGESRTFKSNLALICIHDYLAKYKDAICVFYDSEFGADKSYFEINQIDMDRVFHVPIRSLEELKFDMAAKLDFFKNKEKVIFLLDSLGALSSEKEIKDVEDAKAVADMQRPKVIKTFLRSINGKLKLNDTPFILINHTYQTMDLFSKNVQGGGASVTYFPSDVFFLSRSQEKEGTNLSGYKFTITIEKSRKIKDKTKFSFSVTQKSGIIRHSGIFDLALESGDIVEMSKGRYSLSKEGTKEPLLDKGVTRKLLDKKETIDQIINRQSFKKYLEENVLLIRPNQTDNDDDEIDEDI